MATEIKRYMIGETVAEINPHINHRTEREDSWPEGNELIILRACLDCKTMYEISIFNGR